LSNEQQLARTWLGKHTLESAEDDDDELTTIDRAGNVETLQTLPFGSRLGDCLVSLDEAHTRRTDLILSIDYRAAMTLDLYLTKDRLVQGESLVADRKATGMRITDTIVACMRIRQLGKGQNVVFLVNDEIGTRIQECTRKHELSNITLSDVLRWTTHEQHLNIHQSMPL
jgi:hypothetical protein